MIYSMTGYAANQIQINSATIQLEIKSVNHRFLDITIKSAEEFKSLENQLRTLMAQYINRGKIDIKLFLKDNQSQNNTLELNHELLQKYLNLMTQIEKYGISQAPLTIPQILSIPGILSQTQFTTDEIQEPLLTEFSVLLSKFVQTQSIEGEKLQQLLSSRLTQIAEVVTQIKPLLGKVTAEYQTKLKQRLAEFMRESEINDARLQQELAFFCQKMDVSEELDRLQAHVNEFNALLNKGGQIGKRLDFICQEMHREANTFGSKSVAIETTQKAVDLKVLIEQIREQVQNIM
ncbi:MAG: YicC family protein [Neisseriaceae bacterium]|nr:MAG: YicC family protein [Neisseriaceae bacterium]